TYFTTRAFGRPALTSPPKPGLWRAIAAGDGVIVSGNFALHFPVDVGDHVVLDTPRGPLDRPVLGVTPAFLSPNRTVEMSRALYRRYWDDAQVSRVWVRVRHDAARETVASAIRERLGAARGVSVLAVGDAIEALVAQVRRAFMPVRVVELVVMLV